MESSDRALVQLLICPLTQAPETNLIWDLNCQLGIVCTHTHKERDASEKQKEKKHKWGKVYREMKQLLRIILELNLNARLSLSKYKMLSDE